MNPYQSLPDETLTTLAESDPAAAEALLLRYKNFVKKIVRPYFIMGADREDIIQEGMIGLHKAMREYRPDQAATFASFAAICIKSQVMTAIKNASRKKHGPLNTYISIDSSEDVPHITDNSHNPEKVIISREDKSTLENIVNTSLSNLESAILTHFLTGLSYTEIAAKLGTTSKSVDNALFRIRRKVIKQYS
ncbi:MAG: sigma-70 family RNA polymerase sigma factor [Clostridiales bacterium]|jgi:RNA polymerase sporulation-specific sigma factor|nr:sigma-70 family RNA polymerase sigma factor [Clostridiales bacterium]